METDLEQIEADFWRQYLKEYSDFEGVSPHQLVINNYENIFTKTGAFDLTIDLEAGRCHDSNDNTHTITEFIARLRGENISDTEKHLDIEYTRWAEQEKARKENLLFVRDSNNYRWKKRTGEDSFEEVTDFDIVLNSVIEKYDIKQQEWERYYEATLRYERLGRFITKEISLDPADVHSKDDFSKAVWEKDILQVKNMRRGEMRNFWHHVHNEFNPRIVREYNHYGFIEFGEKQNKKKYFLAENVLIEFPSQKNEPLKLIDKEKGAFPVDDNKYVKPPEDAINLPRFNLGLAQNGIYKDMMNKLLDDQSFERQLNKIEHRFCKMIGGDTRHSQWGKLIIGYVFSYLFFDDIYERFNHIIFLYLYGEGNVGKGELAKLIQDFYGINHLDSLNTPTARPVDNALEQKSQIPQWIDEHVPEVPGKDAKIKDQVWNSLFELKPRPTSMQKNGTWATERKEVRTMPLFCSNFKPKTDHLLSRCLILKYTKQKRGDEEHVQWLKNNRDRLQLLMLSFMQHYSLIDRQAFIWDVERLRNKLKSEVKQELERKAGNALLQDRQISQFAVLITVRHWLEKEYRQKITNIARESRSLDDEEDETHREIVQEQIEGQLQGMLDNELYQFVKNEVVRSAIIAAHHDPLSNYIETIGTLIQAKEINQSHFNWTDEGHLKIWAKAVWDLYIKSKRGTEEIVRRETVENKLKQFSETNPDGSLKTVNWTIYYGDNEQPKETIRKKGFYIKHAYTNELFRNAFKFDTLGPDKSQVENPEALEDDPNSIAGYEPAKDDTDINEDLPF